MSDTNENITAVSQRLSLDHVSCGSGVIYLSGWAFNGRDGCNTVEVFLLRDGLNKSLSIPIVMHQRPDVIKYFSLPAGSLVGFSSQTPLSDYEISSFPPGEYRVYIRATGSDHSVFEKEAGTINIIWPEAIQIVEPDKELRHDRKPVKQSFLHRVWYGRPGTAEMARKIYFSPEITAENLIGAACIIDSESSIAATLSKTPTLRLAHILKSASNNNGFNVIFDHNFGGGANTFSGRTIQKLCQKHNAVLRVWYVPDQSKFTGAVYNNDERYNISFDDINSLFQLLTRFPSFCLQINNLYTWPYIESVLDNIVRLRTYNMTKCIEFYGHDHIGICPSLFLLNENERYCTVPDDINICRKCLTYNTASFKIFYNQVDVSAWRRSWRTLLLNTDYIRFFSQATYDEYLKAFPELDKSANVFIKGHKVSDFGGTRVAEHESDGETRIGIFGFIDAHKGSYIVRDLAESIVKNNLPIYIHVFGSLDGINEANLGGMTIHGPYDHKDMVDIWNEHRLDYAFVPSVCPEAFSLVTAELLEIGAKVITFNLGAQAELANKHDMGYVIPLPCDNPVLESILGVTDNTSIAAIMSKR